MQKYFNKKIFYNNIKFDSKKELCFYLELLELEKQGVIKDIELQPQFELLPSFKHNGKTIRGCKYTADFKYFDLEKQETVIVEIKSKYTAGLKDYILRKKMFLFFNKDVNFIEIME